MRPASGATRTSVCAGYTRTPVGHLSGGSGQSATFPTPEIVTEASTGSPTRVGEPVEASVTISGVGNVALWPEPPLKWPTGVRVYPAQTEVRVAPDAGRIAGSKTFQFLAGPDSSGSFGLPEVRYAYFNPTVGRYAVATSAPRGLAVGRGAEPRAARVVPPLLPSRGPLEVDRVTQRFGWPGWTMILLV